jgi:hypothetical protein
MVKAQPRFPHPEVPNTLKSRHLLSPRSSGISVRRKNTRSIGTRKKPVQHSTSTLGELRRVSTRMHQHPPGLISCTKRKALIDMACLGKRFSSAVV